MLIRISLIIALLAGITVAVLNFTQVNKKITTLRDQRNDWQQKFTRTDAELTQTKNDLDKTTAKLKQTEDTLTATITERDEAVKTAATEQKRAADLGEKLEKATQDLNDAQAYLARYKQSGFEPEQLAGLAKQMKQLQDTIEVVNAEKRILERSLSRATNELARFVNPEYHGPDLRSDMKGKVLACDPKWNFVVINIGADQGMLEHGQLLVSREGKLVGKVSVTSVQKDRAIANLMPGWSQAEIMEGDVVTPAYPAS